MLLVGPMPAAAQLPRIERGWAFEVEESGRVMNERQRPELTPFVPVTRQTAPVSEIVVNDDGTTDIHLLTGVLRLDTRGRLVLLEAIPRPVRPRPGEDPMSAARRTLVSFGRPRPPETNLWDLIAPPPPWQPVQGTMWTDTVHFEVEPLGVLWSEHGVIGHVVVRDTLVDGRALRLVRDSGSVDYRERTANDAYRDPGESITERVASGTLTGYSLYDPDVGTFVLRTDTTLLQGHARLELPRGRTVETGTRVERRRTIRLYSPEQYVTRQAHLAAQRDSARALRGGMVRPRMSDLDLTDVPLRVVQRRLVDGDTVLHDSLVQRMRTTQDANERLDIVNLLREWSELPVPVDELAFELADTTNILGGAASSRAGYRIAYNWRGTIDDRELDWWEPALADPAYAFAFDIRTDAYFSNLASRLSRSPAVFEPDSTRWPCTPAACARIRSWYDSASEPRMRELGLLTRFMFDPAQWADSVRSMPESAILARAYELVMGVANTARESTRAPIPEPGAGWRPWLKWLSGTDAPFDFSNPYALLDLFGFEASPALVVRMHSLLTSRDFAAEFKSGMQNAKNDTAYVVYGKLVELTTEVETDPDSVVAHLLSDSRVLQQLGASEVAALYRRAEPLDTARLIALGDTLLAMAISGAPAWPNLDGSPTEIGMAGSDTPAFISRASLPPALARRWEGRAPIVDRDSPDGPSRRDEHVLVTLSPGRQIGRFVSVGVSYSGWLERAPNEVPYGWAGSRSLWLLETESGWVVVMTTGFIT